MKISKRVFVGGCGSTGTTLVSEILNSHPNMYCGPEASILDRNIALDDPSSHLVGLMKLDNYRRIDQRMPYPIMTTGEQMLSYCSLSSWRWPEVWTYSRRDQVMQHYDTEEFKIKDLVETLLYNQTAAVNKSEWAEKTPGNLFYFDRIAEAWPNSKFILCIRNPWDTIFSLLFTRGFTQHEAVCRYTASLQAAYRWLNSPLGDRIHMMNYDDLTHPDENTRKFAVSEIWLHIHGEVETGSCPPGYEHINVPGMSTFLKYKDRVVDGVLELVYHACERQWRLFCHEFNIENRGIEVE